MYQVLMAYHGMRLSYQAIYGKLVLGAKSVSLYPGHYETGEPLPQAML